MSEFVININDSEQQVKIIDGKKVSINDIEYEYEMTELQNKSYILKLNNRQFQVDLIDKKNEAYELLVNNIRLNTITRSSLEHKAMKLIEQANISSHHHTDMKAPMPGMVLKIKKKPGDNVSQGDSVLILEAMKMENDLKSPASGIIKEINVKEGTAVEKGAKLFSIE